MEIKVCEYCSSMDTSMDLLTHEITCLKCGKVSGGKKSAGKTIDFYGVVKREEVIRPKPGVDPFSIIQRIPRMGKDVKL